MDSSECDSEINEWVREGILIPHSQEIHGSVKMFLPIIAVRQIKGEKTKVRTVLDYRRLIKFVKSHPAGRLLFVQMQCANGARWESSVHLLTSEVLICKFEFIQIYSVIKQ